MIVPSVEHEHLVILDAFLYKELMQTMTTSFEINEHPKVAQTLKQVI